MVSQELALLHNYLVLGALLFGVGLIGFLTRRNMILMFLSVEMMLQGVSVSLVAWGRFHNDWAGQVLVVFMVAVAACEAALALALVLMLHRRGATLDIASWSALREADQEGFVEREIPEEPTAHPVEWPHLPAAGVSPRVSPEETDYRSHV